MSNPITIYNAKTPVELREAVVELVTRAMERAFESGKQWKWTGARNEANHIVPLVPAPVPVYRSITVMSSVGLAHAAVHSIQFRDRQYVFTANNGTVSQYKSVMEMMLEKNAVPWTDDIIIQLIDLKVNPIMT